MSTKIQNYFYQLKIVIVQRKIVIFSVQNFREHHSDDIPYVNGDPTNLVNIVFIVFFCQTKLTTFSNRHLEKIENFKQLLCFISIHHLLVVHLFYFMVLTVIREEKEKISQINDKINWKSFWILEYKYSIFLVLFVRREVHNALEKFLL